MDKIIIRDLEIFARHGVFPEENALGQKFSVSAALYTDLRPAGLSDDIGRSIHYGEVCHSIKRLMEENTYKLIEAAAESIAEALLTEYGQLKKIRLEIAKPWAPIGLPVGCVSVEIERSRHSAYIALGSNIGDRRAYIERAIEALSENSRCRVTAVSELVETEPYGGVPQDSFLNGALHLETLMTPTELLEYLQKIEKDAGRERTVRWGPRTLDLDILFYDDEIVDMPDLQIPHPDIQNRGFVLRPMSELAPQLRHPVLNKTIARLYGELK